MNDIQPVPASIDLEQSVIGAILFDSTRVLGVIDRFSVAPEWFFSPEARSVFASIQDLKEKNAPVDAMTVNHHLKGQDKLEAIGELYLDMCVDRCSSPAHIEYYIEKLRDLYMKREIILPALKLTTERLHTDDSAMDILSELKSSLEGMKTNDPLIVSPEEVRNIVAKQRAQALQSGYTGISSRWDHIQQVLGGYRPGKMCLYGARPSVGKTTIALNEARYQIAKPDALVVPTGFISLETDITEIFEQFAAEHCSTEYEGMKFDLHKYYTGEIKDKRMLKQFDDVMEWYFERPFYPTDKTMDIDQICWTIQYQAMKYGVKLLFLDYIQIIKDNAIMKKMRDPRSKYAYCSQRLFEVFRQTNVAGIVLAQLNRDADLPMDLVASKRWKHIPQLKHLKETGALEQDAYQAILFCPDPDEDNPDSALTIDVLANIAKNKRGPRKRVFLKHKKQEQSIVTTHRPA